MIVIFFLNSTIMCACFKQRKWRETMKSIFFPSKNKLYITNLIWHPYIFCPSSATTYTSHHLQPQGDDIASFLACQIHRRRRQTLPEASPAPMAPQTSHFFLSWATQGLNPHRCALLLCPQLCRAPITQPVRILTHWQDCCWQFFCSPMLYCYVLNACDCGSG